MLDFFSTRFAPNPNACIQEISDIIKSMYDHLWPTYTQIPLKFIWDAEHNLMISKIYHHRTAKRFQQMMSDVCKGRNHLRSWIRLAIKKKLETYFTLDEGFKYRRLKNVANRALLKSSKYTGGSATFMKMKSRLSKSLDREATLAEIFKYTHTLKANKEKFTDERSAAYYENYTQRLEITAQQSQLPSGNNEAGSETSVRYNDLLACVGGVVAISLDLTEKLEHHNRLQEQMEEYNQQIHAGGSGTAGSSGNTAGGTLTSAPTPPP
ncbi:hypothetical protein Ahy_B08g089794 [Arachis hypogaea]|uniref:Uncharacterized protein n=1 Tax=Arachis hypogaea TaxID=3818 RepID=A0A444XYU0_ARAHY|nr:hypothetical protein Ahy_B08g089794 [Arachis hypogaea]